MSERWRDVAGYEGLYVVSNLGNVRSLSSGKLLKPDTCAGYLRYRLSKENHAKHCRAHRLVAEAFLPNPERLPQVNHVNGDRSDNRVENLEWCTGSANQLHSRRVLKNHCGLPKKAVQCVETGVVFPSITHAAKACGVKLASLSRVLNGKMHQTHGLHFKFVEEG